MEHMNDTLNFRNKSEYWKIDLIRLIKSSMLLFQRTRSCENLLILCDENESFLTTSIGSSKKNCIISEKKWQI